MDKSRRFSQKKRNKVFNRVVQKQNTNCYYALNFTYHYVLIAGIRYPISPHKNYWMWIDYLDRNGGKCTWIGCAKKYAVLIYRNTAIEQPKKIDYTRVVEDTLCYVLC